MITDASGGSDRVSGCIWRFAGCEFDERRRELRVRGAEVDIEVKPLAVLHQLLLHAGEVVTKTELLESVWPGVAVADGSLATAISKIRKLLADDGRVIRTVPRVGYKLGVLVHCTPASVPSAPGLHFEPGRRVPGRDQWQLKRRLDLSPSGEVWLAEHTKTREARVFRAQAASLRDGEGLPRFVEAEFRGDVPPSLGTQRRRESAGEVRRRRGLEPRLSPGKTPAATYRGR